MNKIMQITQEQLDTLKNAKNAKSQVELFKNIINLTSTEKYGVGDTTIKVDNAKLLDVFKNTFNNKDVYYIIVNAIDEQMAFAYSLYPK